MSHQDLAGRVGSPAGCLVSIWYERWNEWDTDALRKAVTPHPNIPRFKHYATTILQHVVPKLTLDIGGGTGTLGQFLRGGYVVMDHPRMRQFCLPDVMWVPLGPISQLYPKPDLVVNTNSWGETNIEVVSAYLKEIAEVGIPYLYTCNRKERQVNFEDYPLENWEPLVHEPFHASFVSFLGKLK